MQQKTRTTLTRLLTLLSAALACGACTQPRTQLVPVVDSDLPEASIACVVVLAGPAVRGQPFEPTASPRVFHVHHAGFDPQVSIPFSFGVVPPGDDSSSRVELQVSSLSRCDDPEDATARTVTRIVRSGFVRGQSLALPIYLSALCAGVICPEGQTCEAGECVAIPEIDPTTLAPVGSPGDELPDGSVRADATAPAPDAGPPPPFPPTRPVPSTSVRSLEATDRYGRVYPIGAVGLDAVVVAGSTSVGTTVGGTAVPGPSFLLASLAHDGSAHWVTPLPVGGAFPEPIGEHAVAVGDRALVCGSFATTMSVPGMGMIGPGSGRAVFVARLAPDGAIERFSVVAGDGSGPSPRVRCGGLAVVGDRAHLALHVAGHTALTLDGAPWAVGAGTLSGGQDLVLARVDSVLGGFAAAPPIVVGGHPSTLPPGDAPGLTFTVAADGAGHVLVAESPQLDVSGVTPSAGTIAVRAQAFDASGAMRWSRALATASGGVVTLRAAAASAAGLWIAVSGGPTSGGSSTLTFGSMAPITVTGTGARRSFVARVDPATGDVVSSPLEIPPSAGSGGTFISGIYEHQLTSGDLGVDGAGNAYWVGEAADGAVIAGSPLSVTGSYDAIVVGVDPAGALRGAWQVVDASRVDTRLTHTAYVEGGWLAVGGYVENDGDTAWSRLESFFEIHPLL